MKDKKRRTQTRDARCIQKKRLNLASSETRFNLQFRTIIAKSINQSMASLIRLDQVDGEQTEN